MKRILLLSVTALLLSGLLTSCSYWERKNAGMVAGGVVGGVAGSALTGGSTAGTVAGAVGGAYVGRAVTH